MVVTLNWLMSSATWEICCPVMQEWIEVRARIASAWEKWTELADLLVNVNIPLKCRAHIIVCIFDLFCYLVQKLGQQQKDWKSYCMVTIVECKDK